ncbi:DegT/DnrJ/EryC1/StrS family aminotransferase [Ihubacter massiliensis]|uniref:DegT/DnrJ/EryC1/StrS family aminotransferase n=1 Tax=Hominibacterium faecale TaxID=2839743 RepID=A0A9J6QY30_9FIRM|nr:MULTISPECIES: DegT/DnrJ/EryC1/StrS family aminotransferase [Eubacteriales Family XIII. Incertae Sedis]MCO7123759.1 DegT/DnrJ/EryC1/StrS family aminotransferase [Ihubacter massiliensis]MCU7380414.1 DegT/DnrJ/EryC1/StrS family aminotransferase [Hominibacterium faecale]
MQFRDLKQQYQLLKEDIDKAMIQVATDCNFINGQQVKDLENELAEYVGIKHCITCANGTDALTMAMMAWGIGEGDAVFVPDFTFFSSGEIVSHAGAVPIFVDVDLDTFNISPKALEKAIDKVVSDNTLTPKVIIAVDLFGLPADFKEIRDIAEKYNMLVLEDGAQGFGGSIEGKMACSFGDISTTSFFPAKPLGCYGDGGAVFTDDDELATLLQSIRVHGKGEMKYDNIRIGLNSRLDTIQAAILSVKLRAFYEYELQNINTIAQKYTKLLGDIVKTPMIPEGFYSSWAQYTIQLSDQATRDNLQNKLKKNGIPSMVYYPKAMHRQEAFSQCAYNDKDLINTLKLTETVLSLPMHPYLTDQEIETVAAIIRNVLV